MTIPEHIKHDAETADQARCRGDWSMVNHIAGRYRPGTPDRMQFDWISKELQSQAKLIDVDKAVNTGQNRLQK